MNRQSAQPPQAPRSGPRYYLHGDQHITDASAFYCWCCDLFQDKAHFDQPPHGLGEGLTQMRLHRLHADVVERLRTHRPVLRRMTRPLEPKSLFVLFSLDE